MKKLFILTLLVFSTAVSVFATCGSFDSNPKEFLYRPIHIRINFDIAAPRFGCDGGIGVCKAGLSAGRVVSYTGNQAGANVYFENGVLFVEFPKTDLSANAKAAFVKNSVFPIDSDFPMDPTIPEAMQLAQSITIMSGNYPIKDTGTSYLIQFNCR